MFTLLYAPTCICKQIGVQTEEPEVLHLDHTQFPGSPESELEADFSHLGLCILS